MRVRPICSSFQSHGVSRCNKSSFCSCNDGTAVGRLLICWYKGQRSGVISSRYHGRDCATGSMFLSFVTHKKSANALNWYIYTYTHNQLHVIFFFIRKLQAQRVRRQNEDNYFAQSFAVNLGIQPVKRTSSPLFHERNNVMLLTYLRTARWVSSKPQPHS